MKYTLPMAPPARRLVKASTLCLIAACVAAWFSIVSGGCSAPSAFRCGQEVCEVTINRSCQSDGDCCCTQRCSQGLCLPASGESITEGSGEGGGESTGVELASDGQADQSPADNPPVDTPPTDTPPADTPPVDTPPVDTPPADTPLCNDGETRECYDGPTGTRGQGPCKGGTQTCTNGVWGECQGQVKPSAEICDGKDNNCDGKIDEAFANVGQACQVGKGECQEKGTFKCNADGSATECDATPGTPEKEKCDAKDNDCDGEIDEGCKCKDGDTQKCYSGNVGCKAQPNGNFQCVAPCVAGTQTCENGAWGACKGEVLPGQEKCDDGDEDCDGQIDNGFSTKGQPCVVGLGPCQATGKYVCKADGSGVECSVKPKAPEKELCDGKDNDCDGNVDEDFPAKGNNCTIGAGSCASTGKLICNTSGTALVCNATKPTGTPEKCDGKDNDCDGLTDEGFPNKGQSCTAGVGPCAQKGAFVCKADGSGTECNVKGITPSKEVCDGKDNDCDGKTDEDFPTVGQSCSAGSGACASKGQFVCKSDGSGVFCNAVPLAAKLEECNGKDDDCDGQVDENVVRDCFTTGNSRVNVGVCRAGLQACQNGQWGSCQGAQNGERNERCNITVGTDENCDGTIDEGCWCLRNTSRACGSDVGECNRGRQVCNSNRRWGACQNEIKPTVEKCDGKDNDCDGRADENFPAKGNTCTVGRGACQRKGQLRCKADGSGLECNVKPGTPTTEVCDGQDNDCDGTIDEGCP